MIDSLIGGIMEEQENDNDYVLIFDHFYTNNHIQILKSLLPYMDVDQLPMLPIMIKYMELQYTIRLIHQNIRPASAALSACSKEPPDLETIYHAVHKYLAPEEEKGFQQVINLMHTMDNVREMQQVMEMMQNISNDSDASGTFPDLSNLENMMNSGINFSDMMNFMKDKK